AAGGGGAEGGGGRGGQEREGGSGLGPALVSRDDERIGDAGAGDVLGERSEKSEARRPLVLARSFAAPRMTRLGESLLFHLGIFGVLEIEARAGVLGVLVEPGAEFLDVLVVADRAFALPAQVGVVVFLDP